MRSIFIVGSIYGSMLGIGLLGAISDATLNQWSRSGRISWLLLSYVLWIAVATLLGVLLKSGNFNFGTAVVLFLMANTAFALALDYFVFGGHLSGWQWLGVGFAIVAMGLIEYGRSN